MLLLPGSGRPFVLMCQQHVKKRLSLLSSLSRLIHNIGITSTSLQVSVDEKRYQDLGISEYIGAHRTLTAIVKQHSAHFHVHEIDSDGKIVRLTDLRLPHTTSQQDGQYLHFTLYKEGIGLAEAIHFITKKLKIPSDSFRWAGRKDTIAKTSQRISISNVQAHRLACISSENDIIKLGNFVYGENHLTIGQLRGNHFNILLKDVRCQNSSSSQSLVYDAMEGAMKKFRETGYINYFGLQRFGNIPEVPTSAIGKAVFQRDWEKVFDLILAPKPKDREFVVQAKKIWFSERDPVKIKHLLSGKYYRSVEESSLFVGLSKYYDQGKGNLSAAFRRIPQTVRSLYIPAFISFLWNHVASFRLQEFGQVPIPGDFVYTVPPFKNPDLCSDHPCTTNTAYSSSKSLEWQWPQVKILTEEDISSGQYTINDVLLPILGTKITRYPNSTVQSFFEKFLLDQGLQVDCFKKFKDFIPKGSYRPLVMKPQNVHYKMFPYSDLDNCDKFIPSDWDILSETEGDMVSSCQHTNVHATTTESSSVKDKIGAVVEFSLPSASYATMALREILQISSE